MIDKQNKLNNTSITETKKHCLFSAPFSFLNEKKEAFYDVQPTIFKEIWDMEELTYDPNISAWIINPGQRFVINSNCLELFPSLEVLITPSTGRNHIDIQTCEQRKITVLSLLDDRESLNSISASAEFTFLLLLNTLRRLDIAMGEVSQGRWRQHEDMMRGNELNGCQVGIVGLGRIGQRMAQWCTAFNAKVVYYDPYINDNEYSSWSLERIFSDSDVVCICCSLNAETKGMINRTLLERLKFSACLVNTSRGEVINESDLLEILKRRKDLRVGLDVLAGEVTKTHLESPLIEMHKSGRIVITPHIAGVSFESQTKAAMCALKLLKSYMETGTS